MSTRYFHALLFRAAKLQSAIEREKKSGRPDWVRLLKLKRLHLIIKERLQRIAASATPLRLAPARIAPRAVGLPLRLGLIRTSGEDHASHHLPY